jgi:hypothetical protein
MPRVTLKTGIVGTDGQEVVLSEYLCDWPDCPNIAEHVVGVARDVGWTCVVCREHLAAMQDRISKPGQQ